MHAAELSRESAEAVVISKNLLQEAGLTQGVRVYIDIDSFQPAKLGLSEPMLHGGPHHWHEEEGQKHRDILSIQKWVVCFNSYLDRYHIREGCNKGERPPCLFLLDKSRPALILRESAGDCTTSSFTAKRQLSQPDTSNGRR